MNYSIMFALLVSSVQVFAYNPEQLNRLLQAIEQNEEEINCSRCDFRGLGDALKGKDLSSMNMAGVLFNVVSDSAVPAASLIKNPGQPSDLTGCNFSQTNLVSANFAGAILKGANFTDADIAYVNFADADLTGVVGLDTAKNASLARFAGAIMPDGTKPTGATWTSPSGHVFYLRNQTAQ